jgi:hypothetical protein
MDFSRKCDKTISSFLIHPFATGKNSQIIFTISIFAAHLNDCIKGILPPAVKDIC